MPSLNHESWRCRRVPRSSPGDRTGYLIGAGAGDVRYVGWVAAADLYKFCTTPNQEQSCIGYIEAVADTLGNIRYRAFGVMTCTPPGTNGFRLREIVIDFIERQPVWKSFTGAEVAAFALSAKFPCSAAPH